LQQTISKRRTTTRRVIPLTAPSGKPLRSARDLLYSLFTASDPSGTVTYVVRRGDRHIDVSIPDHKLRRMCKAPFVR
jgi:hypothetical protein